MKTTLKRIHTEDGLELVGLLYEPDISTKEILVHVHGMGGNFYENRFLDSVAEVFTREGIAFFAFNNRGCESFKDLTKISNGKKTLTRIGNAYEKFEDCLLDIKAAIDVVSKWGFESVHLSGHSLGSPKTAYYLSKTGDSRVSSLLLLSPSDMVGLVQDQPERFESDNQKAQALVKAGKGKELLGNQIWDEYPISASSYLSLFERGSAVDIFNFHNPSGKLEALGRIKQPIFVVMGRKDSALIVPIEETMKRIIEAASNSIKVETKILGDANHGYDGYEEQLAVTMLRWIQKI